MTADLIDDLEGIASDCRVHPQLKVKQLRAREPCICVSVKKHLRLIPVALCEDCLLARSVVSPQPLRGPVFSTIRHLSSDGL